jgi:hypothetical protein
LGEADAIAIKTPVLADANAIAISHRKDGKRSTFLTLESVSHYYDRGSGPSRHLVGRVRHATSWLGATFLEPRDGA